MHTLYDPPPPSRRVRAPYLVLEDGTQLAIPAPPPSAADEVWHYTDAGGLIGIITGHQMWAHSADSMNDLSELRYGVDRVREEWAGFDPKLKRRQEAASAEIERCLAPHVSASLVSEVFIFSASRRRDHLPLWQGYAGGQGYAISIAPTIDLAPLVETAPPAGAVGTFIAPGWFDVVYDHDEQGKSARSVFEFLLDPHVGAVHVVGTLASLVVSFKDSAFAAEQEVRYVFYRMPWFAERFRPGRDGVVRYLPFVSRQVGFVDDFLTSIEMRLPITGVTVGPGDVSRRKVSIETVRRILEVNGYRGNLPVHASHIPYRV